MNKVFRFIADSKFRLDILSNRNAYRNMCDEAFLKKEFHVRMGKKLDLKNPQTFNEKLQWLKLYDRKPIYTTMVDKYAAKQYVAERIGEEYIIPTLGVWDCFDDIDFTKLPNQFVLKCTHDSGGIVICRDASSFDIEAAKKTIEKSLRRNYYLIHREWPYKDVPRRIIAEPYMVDESGVELKDYKIFCFNGEPDYIEVDFNRFVEHKLNTYNFDWEPLNFCDTSKSDYSANIKKPEKIEEMREIAKKLSAGMKFLRVDFYYINEAVYVGELTLHPGSGYIQYDPPEMDLIYGRKLDLGK